MKGTIITPIDKKGLKYNINVLLKKLTYEEYRRAIGELPKKLGISPMQFWRIRNYPANSTSSATSDQLLLIAEYLSQYSVCTVDDLINKSES